MSMTTTSGQAAATVTADEESLLNRILDRVDQAVERRAVPPVQPMELRSFAELERWAERAARSGMVPRDYINKPDSIIIAVQMGSELGLRPMQSLANIAVINGRPSLWGDAMLALCMTHPLYAGVEEHIEGEGDNMRAVCIVQRRGDAPKTATFSVADAKTAKLWGKRGKEGQDTPWITNPKRMLQMRARGFALRDAFPDKLRGLIAAEEASDYEPISAAPAAPTSEPPRRTLSQFLDGLEIELREAPDYAAVVAIVGRDDVQRAQNMARNGLAERLAAMLEAARVRWADDAGGEDRL